MIVVFIIGFRIIRRGDRDLFCLSGHLQISLHACRDHNVIASAVCHLDALIQRIKRSLIDCKGYKLILDICCNFPGRENVYELCVDKLRNRPEERAFYASLLEKLGVRCALLTASTKAKTRRSILEQLAAGEIDLAIGTHALLSPDISYQNLGLVVTDEQHRFGVNQRAALGAKGENPHLLVMSATPIPRTLALMIYGDLDVSVIDELPPGRRSIETYAVPSSYHERIYAFLEKQLAEGRQAYIVCPMVEENGELPDERKAVTAYAEKLQKEVLPNRTVRFLHGKMKAKEKETVMRAFAAGEIDVLVSTTVVEVGVDVPNASVMLIENAECFGLSQLHQLRGRVGRGPWQSYCILVSDNRGEDNKTRLDVMRRTQSGFALAEEDLKLRGPGDFFGARQHGLPTLRVADFACDMELLYEAQGAAEALLALDPRLEGHPALHARVRELFDLNAEALN